MIKIVRTKKGLMIGFEMSEDRTSKKALRPELVSQIWEGMRENGVLLGRGGLWGQTFRGAYSQFM